jgi:tetratricopeptide (TPR) repeat protein/transcriptional regulator with XRE-family HTH domain
MKVKNLTGPITSRLRQEREQRGWTQSEVAERIGSTRINVGRWENGITVPGPYYRQKLGELFGKSIAELGLLSENEEERDREEEIHTITNPDPHVSSPPVQPIWSVPYRRNPFFTGREEVLAHLYTVLNNSRIAALTQAQAISGLGGIGKTQIAIEYAYRFRDQYRAVLWVNASTREVLRADYMTLAALLDLPEQHGQDQDITIRAVKRWLDTNTQWLLILDNVDRPEIIVDYLPLHPEGDVLLTTRLYALGKVAQSVEVEKMGQNESVLFLLRRARLLDPPIPLELTGDEDKTLAAEIVTALDGLPLALDQAGAYIEETHCGLPQYLELYGTRRRELLLRRGTFSLDHPDSVVATWLLSFAQIREESPAASDLLRLLTFLHPEDIPDEIIMSSPTELDDVLDAVTSDRLLLNAAIELLLRYSLIRRNPKALTLSIHRLVQAVLKDSMDKDTQRMWAVRAIRAVNEAFPDVGERKNWEKCQRYLPHIFVCVQHIDEYALALPEAARLLNDAAEYLVIHAQYQQAEELLQKALVLRRQILEASHPDLIRTINNLGLLYRSTGDFSRGEQFLLEALSKQEQALGQHHIDVAQTQYNLARLYRAQGAYLKAEPFYWQALHTRESILEHDDPLVAQSYYGLAKLYYSLEKFQQAEELCAQALRIQEQRVDTNDLIIASILDILAKIYTRQHKFDQAIEVNARALHIREDILGGEHPQVAILLNNLVEIYHAQGKYKEAELLIGRALHIDEKALGSEHPNIAYSFYNLAENFSLQDNHEKAKFYYQKALAIREKTLGTSHPRTGLIYIQLSKYYTGTGSHEEAESLYLKALSIRERAFGFDHAIVAGTLEQYAVLLKKLNRAREACEVEARIQEIQSRQINPEGT